MFLGARMGRLTNANAVERVEVPMALAVAEVTFDVTAVAVGVVVRVSRQVVAVIVSPCHSETLERAPKVVPASRYVAVVKTRPPKTGDRPFAGTMRPRDPSEHHNRAHDKVRRVDEVFIITIHLITRVPEYATFLSEGVAVVVGRRISTFVSIAVIDVGVGVVAVVVMVVVVGMVAAWTVVRATDDIPVRGCTGESNC